MVIPVMRWPSQSIPAISQPARNRDTAPTQIADPRVDPPFTGGAVEDTRHATVGPHQVEGQLAEDQSACPRGHFLGPRGHQGAGHPIGEELLEFVRLVFGPGEVPPALQVELLVAALVARAQQGQQARHEFGEFVRRDVDVDREVPQELDCHRDVVQRGRPFGDADDLGPCRRPERAGSGCWGPDDRRRCGPRSGCATWCPGCADRNRGRTGTRARPAGVCGRRWPIPAHPSNGICRRTPPAIRVR